jgi:O-antigen ligase
MYQYFGGNTFQLQFLGESENLLQVGDGVTIPRVTGLLYHPNMLAWFLNGLLPLLFLCGIVNTSPRLRLFYLVSFVLGVIALILSFSRGGWLAFVFSFLFIGWFLRKKLFRRYVRRGFVWILLLTIVSSIFIAPFLSKLVTRLTADDYGAAYSRIPMAQTAFRIISKNTLKGVGLGNYQPVVSDYDPNPSLDETGKPHPVHNIYLHIAAELGVPALLLLMWILFVFFKCGILALRSQDMTTAFFSLGLLAGCFGTFTVHAMVDPGTIGHLKLAPYFFYGGLLISLKNIRIH